MKVIYDFKNARVINNGTDPGTANNIIVQIKDGDGWKDVGSHNSLSDDYAYTSARDSALHHAKFYGVGDIPF